MTDAETKQSVQNNKEQSPESNKKKKPASIVISGTKIMEQRSQSESAKKAPLSK